VIQAIARCFLKDATEHPLARLSNQVAHANSPVLCYGQCITSPDFSKMLQLAPLYWYGCPYPVTWMWIYDLV